MTRAEPRELTGAQILVTVGTDHHPFDRLIGWTNDWLARNPMLIPACFIQSGPASTAPACAGLRFVDVDRLSALLDAADVVVCHGGPGSIADAWERGRVPLVVPRLPQLGEIVDEHQVDFCRRVAERGRVHLAETQACFDELLDDAVRNPALLRADSLGADVDVAVARLGELIEEMISRPRRRLPPIARGRRARRQPGTSIGITADAGITLPPIGTDHETELAPSSRVGELPAPPE